MLVLVRADLGEALQHRLLRVLVIGVHCLEDPVHYVVALALDPEVLTRERHGIRESTSGDPREAETLLSLVGGHVVDERENEAILDLVVDVVWFYFLANVAECSQGGHSYVEVIVLGILAQIW